MVILKEEVRANLPLMGLSELDALIVAQNPDFVDKFNHLGLNLKFCTKILTINEMQLPIFAIVGILDNNEESLDFIFRLKKGFTERYEINKPSQILKMFIKELGLEIKISNEIKKLHMKAAIPIPPNTPHLDIRGITNKENIWFCSYYKITYSGPLEIFEGGLVFAIDKEKYFEWLNLK